MKKLIYILMFLICASFVSGMMDPGPFYCERMDYEVDRDNYECVFDDGNRCHIQKFLIGECGQEYVKELPCVTLGEPVFSNFEKCCEGEYVYAPKYLVGQATCQPLSKVIIGNLKYNSLYWLGGLVILVIIGYFVYKKVKK